MERAMLVVLRSLLWPGLTFYHAPRTKNYGYIVGTARKSPGPALHAVGGLPEGMCSLSSVFMAVDLVSLFCAAAYPHLHLHRVSRLRRGPALNRASGRGLECANKKWWRNGMGEKVAARRPPEEGSFLDSEESCT